MELPREIFGGQETKWKRYQSPQVVAIKACITVTLVLYHPPTTDDERSMDMNHG